MGKGTGHRSAGVKVWAWQGPAGGPVGGGWAGGQGGEPGCGGALGKRGGSGMGGEVGERAWVPGYGDVWGYGVGMGRVGPAESLGEGRGWKMGKGRQG